MGASSSAPVTQTAAPTAQAGTQSPSSTSQPANLNSLPSVNYGVGQNQHTISPGQVESNDTAGASSILAPQANPTSQVSQSFLPANLSAPFYNQAATAGNLGTQAGSLTDGSTSFLNNLFNSAGGSSNNYLNQMQSSTLSPAAQAALGAGTQSALVAMNQGLAQQNAEFADTPFSSALPVAQGNIIGQYANNLTSQAAQLGLQQEQLGTQAAESQQQLASQQADFPFNFTLGASAVPVQDAQGVYNMGQQSYTSPYSIPETTYNGIPYIPASTVTQASGSNKSLL